MTTITYSADPEADATNIPRNLNRFLPEMTPAHLSGCQTTLYLHFLVSDIGQVGAICGLGGILRVDVQVLQQNSLGECWPEENVVRLIRIWKKILFRTCCEFLNIVPHGYRLQSWRRKNSSPCPFLCQIYWLNILPFLLILKQSLIRVKTSCRSLSWNDLAGAVFTDRVRVGDWLI